MGAEQSTPAPPCHPQAHFFMHFAGSCASRALAPLVEVTQWPSSGHILESLSEDWCRAYLEL
jgi:hypothetical protein